jgi:hypothetical protein
LIYISFSEPPMRFSLSHHRSGVKHPQVGYSFRETPQLSDLNYVRQRHAPNQEGYYSSLFWLDLFPRGSSPLFE